MSKRLLQVTLAILSLLPLTFGILGILYGVERFDISQNPELDSQFRFLSTWYLGLTFIVWWMIPNIENHTKLFRIICTVIFVGGLSRLLAINHTGIPENRFIIVLIIELLFPALIIWQSTVNRTSKSKKITNK